VVRGEVDFCDLRIGAVHRGVRLLCEKLDDSEVLGNELQLEQVFRNFLAKAVKFNLPQRGNPDSG